VPWLAEVDKEWVLGDLRYDREAELGFSEIEITAQPSCPSFVPQWVPPRLDLFGNESRERATSVSP
jgi:inner membrane protein